MSNYYTVGTMKLAMNDIDPIDKCKVNLGSFPNLENSLPAPHHYSKFMRISKQGKIKNQRGTTTFINNTTNKSSKQNTTQILLNNLFWRQFYFMYTFLQLKCNQKKPSV